MAACNDECEYFNTLADKINNLFFGQTAKDLKILESILDEFNSINYRCAIVTNETVRYFQQYFTTIYLLIFPESCTPYKPMLYTYTLGSRSSN